MALNTAIDKLGFGGMFGDTFATISYAFSVFLIAAVIFTIVGVMCYFIYVQLKYKWVVMIRVQRQGDNHHWIKYKGGNFIGRKGQQSFKVYRFLQRDISLPPVPSKAVEPMVKGKSMVFLYKHNTGEYDYLPFIPKLKEGGLDQEIFDVDMQNWVRGKIRSDLDKFKWKDFLEKYQMIISVGLILGLAAMSYYGIYKINEILAQNLAEIGREVIAAKKIQCPTQFIPPIG